MCTHGTPVTHKLLRATAITVLRRLAELESDPFGVNTTALVGSPEYRRLRVGDHRAVSTVNNGAPLILVIRVGHRSTVYRD
ncbi:type II toxin-antitoxin system RelE/ParE family toxin [Streptomyces sp. CB01881]|uniref:type II toxin-antitoxin system RelE family toxin n=1 Tax=Streptomyces sp. CB01881 TaxID=2078691 RepID=UPI000CDBD937|nr:type II toxin-antitoxin system RelE/ParE family toxin [Streptomyces sp. CB01881]AUY50014.1 type II toxin-antitoxin system RelE/ParE family toxin [Streptomyces sp. CB01881]TYC73411.1 type II toxin-antitoxin system RelE/ParE family toxin [Streptomyces sp. CB01881]